MTTITNTAVLSGYNPDTGKKVNIPVGDVNKLVITQSVSNSAVQAPSAAAVQDAISMPVWSSANVYHSGQFVTDAAGAGARIYFSLIDNNLNNPLTTSPTAWRRTNYVLNDAATDNQSLLSAAQIIQLDTNSYNSAVSVATAMAIALG